MNSVLDTSCEVGFPIRKLPGQSSFASSPTLIAGYHVLHRLLPPRHPPYALPRLTIYPQGVCGYGADSHCERDIFKLESKKQINNQLSLENLASKQKLLRIVKEQTMRSSASPADRASSVRSRKHTETNMAVCMSSRHRTAREWAGGWWSQPGSNRRPPACKAG